MRERVFSVARFTLLPGIVPRTRKLLFSGFDYIAIFIAVAFASLRLLPANHPYLNPVNQGRFGIRHVLGEAKRRLIFDRYHTDQVVLYYTLLLGFGILCLQFIFAALAISTHGAHAAGFADTMHSYFVTENNKTDIAYNLLDLVFAFDGIFDSNSAGNGGQMVPKSLAPVHAGLHILFKFYNTGILAVAALVFLYMITTVIMESSETGVPFGKRFNGAWAPLRMIFAVGLLMPLPTFGINGGQWMTMYVAKWGSSVATNGWIKFLDSLQGQTPLGQKDSLIVEPRAPSINALVEFLFVAETCANFQNLMYGTAVNGYVISENTAAVYLQGPAGGGGGGGTVDTFDAARKFTNQQNIYIRFGEQDDDYVSPQGHIRPVCGDMTFKLEDTAQPGSLAMQATWYKLIKDIWTNQEFSQTALNLATRYVPNERRDPDAPVPSGGGTMVDFVKKMTDIKTQLPTQGNNTLPTAFTDARTQQINAPSWDKDFRQLGWAGAAIWYNKLAEMNGSFMAAVHDVPRGGRYPEVMETISEQKRQTDALIDPQQRFQPYEAIGNRVDFANPADKYEAMVEYTAQQIWRAGYMVPTNSSMIDVIRAIFGLEDLFSMRDNINAGVNPLAQLAGLGRGLLEASIQNLGFSFGAGIVSGLADLIGMTPMKTIGAGVAKFTTKIGMIGFTLGFMLFYVVPFMPFIYFFFSAGTWVKSIFTGLVGIPLWAIAHLRIDGEGLPGPMGMTGYFLLFEIFIRPILTVMGLIGGLTIFGAQAFVLDQIWDLVTSNLTGYDYDPDAVTTTADGVGDALTNTGNTTGTALGSVDGMRGIIDQFMFTIMFTVIIYIMALSSFKMADMVPDKILRWMGMHERSFGEFDPNPAEKVMSQVTEGLGMLADRENAPLMALLSRNS